MPWWHTGASGAAAWPWIGVGLGTVATWGTAVEDEVDAMGFKWKRYCKSSKHIPFD